LACFLGSGLGRYQTNLLTRPLEELLDLLCGLAIWLDFQGGTAIIYGVSEGDTLVDCDMGSRNPEAC